MTDQNPLGDRGRALEDDYFRRRDRELLERLRTASAAEEERRNLGALTGLHDADVTELQALGFTRETVTLLPLIPLLQVAWAEGGISDAERTLIVQFARARGIAAGDAADVQLAAWLTSQPGPDVYAGASRLVGAMLDGPATVGGGLSADELVAYCERIAAASGGFLGLKRIAAEERALLATIARDLKNRPQ